jgi:hypothetical protein
MQQQLAAPSLTDLAQQQQPQPVLIDLVEPEQQNMPAAGEEEEGAMDDEELGAILSMVATAEQEEERFWQDQAAVAVGAAAAAVAAPMGGGMSEAEMAAKYVEAYGYQSLLTAEWVGAMLVPMQLLNPTGEPEQVVPATADAGFLYDDADQPEDLEAFLNARRQGTAG